ncbi:MAG: YraN family protein [Woeseiaceae bacterium]|nr:YraN family protein [Woeseiaceae bacterium]
MGNRDTGVVGRRAETFATRFLRARGLVPVARNFRSRGGEIDLIMLDNECLAFIEVRSRSSSRFDRPANTVDARKQRKIIRTAALFVVQHPQFAEHTMRFDVVAIEGATQSSIRWISDAFRPDDSAL